MRYLYFYLLIINALSLLFMLADKRKAIKGRFRIPESTLLTLCALGGSLGGLLAMKLFRHKTRHPQFSLGIPILLAIHTVAMIILHML